ncbi:amino acid transporter [Hysterangium stoloniferum]|nr:amino acid transporter [Hysterangium stoloniferum]
MADPKQDGSDIEKDNPSLDSNPQDAPKGGLQYVEGKAGEGLQRQLKNRHAQMLTIGGVIGTGLFLGTASSLAAGGPAGLLLGYLVVATVCVGVMLALGEIITFLPVPGGQMTLAGRFVDPALTFALGWTSWYAVVISLPAEISACSVLVNFWNKSINNSVWMTINLASVLIINFLGTRAFGECEFWFGTIKILTIIGLIILGLVIDLGGAPNHDRLGFRYYHDPGAFTQYEGIEGAKGQFLGFWSVLIGAGYAFLGTEVIGISAAETHDPTKTLPKAIKGVYVRIVLFYIIGVFIIGLICPSNNPDLITEAGTANSSAWVIAIKLAGIKGLPSLMNAAMITSAASAGSSSLYVASRTLYGLSRVGMAPPIFLRTNRRGTPWIALLLGASFSLLSYTGLSSGSSRVFTWFANMSTVAGMFNWMGICITYLRFRAGLKAQGLSRDILPYKSKMQPYITWWALAWIILIILFANWPVFLRNNWDNASFVTNYLPIPLFVMTYLGYKFVKKTRLVRGMVHV